MDNKMNIEKNNFTILDDVESIKSIDVTKYISIPWMTKYEFDQLIGIRTMHLARGAIPFIELPSDYKIKSNMDLRKIAIEELEKGRLPYIIKRTIPNKEPEYWPVSKLNIDSIRYMMR